ncbi:MAG: hypothetical protein A2V66_03540 [Ignavibacteria bacterium RBG_13_36_8]|nr:MAG: hypothetical protein A2V66_03540 [Ignavibacteria bacterium RBG_13_36_8]
MDAVIFDRTHKDYLIIEKGPMEPFWWTKEKDKATKMHYLKAMEKLKELWQLSIDAVLEVVE